MARSRYALGGLLFLSIGAPAYPQLTTIHFGEFPTCDSDHPPPYGPPCVTISNQYAPQGVVFLPAPSYPYTVWEDSEEIRGDPPPYLVAGSRYTGDIYARFVDPQDPTRYVARRDVRFKAGAFDALGSTTIYWLDSRGAVIASQRNQTSYAAGDPFLESIVAPGPVGGFRISITCGTLNCEDAGYSIDTLQFGAVVHCALDGAHCEHDPNQDKDLGCSPHGVGNPCDPGTGNKHQREDDYAGAGLSFSRYYNSGLAMDVGLGFGWISTFHKRLETYVDGTLRARRADGRAEPFRRVSSAWQAEPDSASTLVEDVSGFLLTREDKTVERYDPSGRILHERAANGRTLTYSYSSSTGQLERVTDTFGKSLSFAYGADGRLQQMTDPAGRSVFYAHDGPGNLVNVIYPDNTTRFYHYENPAFPHHLTGITDESGNRFASWTYDERGRVTSSEHAGGADRVTLAYSSTDRSTTVTDALGTSRVYTFVTRLGATRNTGISQPCDDCAAARTYDTRGNVTSIVDFEGNRTCFAYDTARNLETARVEGFGPLTTSCPVSLASYEPAPGSTERKTTTTWHASWPFPTAVVRSDRRTEYTYDAQGNLLSEKITDTSARPRTTRTWTHTYSDLGQLLREDGPRTDVSDITTYTYYACNSGAECGQVHTITNALGHVLTFESYDVHGLPLAIRDSNGVLTTLAYDTRQRLVSYTAGGEVTHFEHWPTGLLRSAALPDGTRLHYRYDAAHRLTEIADTEGNRIVYSLDAAGNRTGEDVYDASGVLARTHTRVYDSLGRLLRVLTESGGGLATTLFAHDRNGNLTEIHAPLGRSTRRIHDELNRLRQVVDPAGVTTHLQYDEHGNLVSLQDPKGLTTTYAHTGFGELKSQTSPDSGTTTLTYDAVGNVITSTDARKAIVTRTYDALDRLTSVAFKLGKTTDQTLRFTYDGGPNGKGRLTGASDEYHSITWTHDALGRVIRKTQSVGGITRPLSYGYENGRLVRATLPSGQIVTYGYDTNGRISSIAVGSTTVLDGATYQPFGPITGWMWGNGTFARRTYDTGGKIMEIDSGGLRSYAYDEASRIVGMADLETPSRSFTYGYDELDRLTSASGSSVSYAWTYDANGNRLSQSGTDAAAYTIAPTSNRILSATGRLARTYSYDAAGNTLGYTQAAATYNHRGRMKTLTRGSATVTYVYDALGRRIRQSGGAAGTVLYMYDEAGRLVGEYTGTGALIQETVWLGDLPVATLRPSGSAIAIFYVHADHRNAPIRVTRPTDNRVMWTWDSGPFGTGAPNENPQGAGAFKYNLRFPGQIFDAHAGLHDNYFRDYDPATGRYIQADPIGLAGGLNPYAYVGSNPLSFIDLWGLVRRCIELFSYRLHESQDWSTIRTVYGREFILPGPGGGHLSSGVNIDLPSTIRPSGGISPGVDARIILWRVKIRHTFGSEGYRVRPYITGLMKCVEDDECRDPTPKYEEFKRDHGPWKSVTRYEVNERELHWLAPYGDIVIPVPLPGLPRFPR